MKAILNIHSEYSQWFLEFFNFRNPYTLPFVAKPLAYHLLDFCSNLKIDEVLILDYLYNERLAQQFNKSSLWYPKLKYIGVKTIPNVKHLVDFHHKFCENDDTLVLNGLFFIGGSSNHLESQEQLIQALEPANTSPTSSGIYLYRRDGLFKVKLPGITQLNSIQDYFNLNLSLLKPHRPCSLPGYAQKDGVVFGINPVIMPGSYFSTLPPAEQPLSEDEQEVKLLFGDNVRLERNCTFQGPVIIGSNVVIDEMVHVERSIILDNSYISYDLEIKDKIIEAHTIIDPISQAKVTIERNDLLASAYPHIGNKIYNFIGICFDYLLTIWLVLHLSFCYTIFLLFFFSWTTHSKYWFFKLSLDKYTGAFQCLKGRKKLVGYAYPPAQAALFTYTESISDSTDTVQLLIDDQYFQNHNTFFFRIALLFSILIKRLFQSNAHLPVY